MNQKETHDMFELTYPSQVALILSLLASFPHVGVCTASWTSTSFGGVGGDSREKSWSEFNEIQSDCTQKLGTWKTSLQLSAWGLRTIRCQNLRTRGM